MTRSFRMGTRPSKLASGVALMTLALFGAILILEHFLQPGLSGLTHQISEYADHPSGWLMRLGFVFWAASLAACAFVQLQREPASPAIRLSAGSLGLAAAALIVTAMFNTETVAGQLPPGVHLTAAGRLHDLGSGIATLAITCAAIADACAKSTSLHVRRLAWIVVACAIASDVGLLIVGPSVGGLRERVLVVLGCLWEAVFAGAHLRAGLRVL